MNLKMFFIHDYKKFVAEQKKLSMAEKSRTMRCKSIMKSSARWQCNKQTGHSGKHTFGNSEYSLSWD
jgi:hypothetical protein